jgi:hypothetical protein
MPRLASIEHPSVSFPREFDPDIYRRSHPDLEQLSASQLAMHWEASGHQQGWLCSAIGSRDDFLALIDARHRTLEVGQLHNPLVKHAKNIDVFTQQELVQKYRHVPQVDTERIVPVHYVVKDNVWNIHESFECVVSSHNIEHTPCLVQFLKNAEAALTDDGLFFLIIPDYRYCFDRHRFPSTIIDVLDAWLQKAARPGPRVILEHNLLATHNDPKEHWKNPYSLADESYMDVDVNKLRSLMNLDFDRYHDTHCWRLYPKSFKVILHYLSQLHLTGFRVERLYPTLKDSVEFYAILRKCSP